MLAAISGTLLHFLQLPFDQGRLRTGRPYPTIEKDAIDPHQVTSAAACDISSRDDMSH